MTRILLLVASLSLLLGCEDKPVRSPGPSGPKQASTNSKPAAQPKTEEASPLEGTDVGARLKKMAATAKLHREKLEGNGKWDSHAALAAVHMGRARLTGDVGEYLKAKQALDAAFDAAPQNSGPHLAAADYHFTVHQLDEVERYLAASEKKVLRQDKEIASVAGLRGDVAFQQGDLKKALELYRRAEETDDSFASAGRMGQYMLKTGEYDEARKWYLKAAERARGDELRKGWALLHRGIVDLETGKVADALEWYEKANEEFSGWYLIEEHIAEAKLLLGEPEEAVETYESIVANTPNGEFMSALADAADEAGDAKKAAQWRGKAREAFERDVARLPSAASGHALEFYLATDPERALELAEKNYELRPGHEARTLYAQAALATGDPEKARELLEPVVDTAWATPAYLATIAVAFEEVEPATASKAKKRATEVDESAVDDLRAALGLADDEADESR